VSRYIAFSPRAGVVQAEDSDVSVVKLSNVGELGNAYAAVAPNASVHSAAKGASATASAQRPAFENERNGFMDISNNTRTPTTLELPSSCGTRSTRWLAV
jgi:hypothetical protein